MKLHILVFTIFIAASSPTDTVQAPSDTRSPTEIYAEKTASAVPTGPQIFGVFRGRTPCQDLAQLLKTPAVEACNKVKCRLTLYQDPVTKTPTTYEWAGKVRATGKWSLLKDSKTHPNKIVYQLDMPEHGGGLSLLQVDDNILYILNKAGDPLVGNVHFSYTLNRILKPK
jgi:hypothetical protein